jgi:hypothetical protein
LAVAGSLASLSPADSLVFKSTPFPDGLVGVGKAFPRMENGVVLMHEAYTKSAAPNVVILPLGDKAPISASLWPTDSVVVSVFDLSARRDHTAVAVTQAVNAGEQRAWLTMSLDATGKVVGQFRTNPYAALDVAVDDAGNIWTLGVDYDAKDHKADYNILREYSQDGRIVTTALPRSSFAPGLEPAMNKGGLTGRNFLRVHGPNVAAFIAQTHEWIEVSPAGRVISRVKVQLPSRPGYPSTGPLAVAVTDDGGVFLQSAGFSLCKLDTASGACGTVDTPEEILLGASGNDLLLYNLFVPTQVDWVHQQ